MNSCQTFLACVALLLVASGAVADPGTTAYDVFALGRSARSDALVAGVSLPGDAGSLQRNPATLEDIDRMIVSAGYQSWYVDTWFGRAGYVSPCPWLDGAFGVDVVYFSEGEAEDVDPVTGGGTGSFKNGNLGLSAGYGFALPWAKSVDVGLSMQVSRHTLLDESATSFTVGGGLAAGVWDDALRVGLSASGLGTGVRFDDGATDPSAWNVSGGVSFVAPGMLPEGLELTICSDVVKTKAIDVGYNVGGELSVYDVLWVRAGYDDTIDDAHMHYGLGVRAGLLEIDYAYVDHEALGSSNNISIAWSPESR